MQFPTWKATYVCAVVVCVTCEAVEAHSLQFEIDERSGTALPCRIHLQDADGNWIRAGSLPFFRDHFVCDGRVELNLPSGTYRYTIQRGPEYTEAQGEVELDGATTIAVTLKRISEVRQQGWYAADLHVHRPVEHIEQLMRAEDLDFAPVITWWNARNLWAGRVTPPTVVKRFDNQRIYTLMAGEDEREGGALLFFNLKTPLEISSAKREYPSPLAFVDQARAVNPQVAIDIEKPFWWDTPTWLASGKVHSVGLANNHMWRAGMLPDEAWGKPRDTTAMPAPLGNAQWSQTIYYQMLEAGLRIPPSAGSASGVLPNPVGYNRVYVHLDDGLSRDAWWQGMHAGRSFVTNGPMLICRANGNLPGHVFKATTPLMVELGIELASRDRILQLEVVSNGKVVHAIPCQDVSQQQLHASFRVAESGWFLVRGIADNTETFRFASTAPFYVELDGRRRITRSSLQFFQDWVTERIGRVENNLESATELREVLRYHLEARRYWAARMQEATSD